MDDVHWEFLKHGPVLLKEYCSKQYLDTFRLFPFTRDHTRFDFLSYPFVPQSLWKHLINVLPKIYFRPQFSDAERYESSYRVYRTTTALDIVN